MSLPILILAGGLATRLRPKTEKIPKSLISVAGRPFIYHQLELLAKNNIKKVVISTGYLGEQICEAVGNGKKFGLNVTYVNDGPVLLGTGGAVANALPILADNFFIMYGDSYLDCNYQEISSYFFQANKPALMTVLRNENKWDISNVEYDGNKIFKYSKKEFSCRMKYIDYGLGVFSKIALKDVSRTIPSDLSEVYSKLANENNLAAYEVLNRFYEIGTKQGIEETELYISEKKMSHAKKYLDESIKIIQQIDFNAIDKMALGLKYLRESGGRLFFLGVGGSAGNCSHAVNDFRKIVGIEAYAPTDNVSELTARTNDEGWDTIFVEWLKISKLCASDAIFVFSVGGGNLEKNISPNLVKALDYAKQKNSKVFGVVGRDGGYTGRVGDHIVIVPIVNDDHITPHSEAFQAVIWHLLVSHPDLKLNQTKWESAVGL